MKKKRNNTRAARKAARVKPPTLIKKEDVKTHEVIETKREPSFAEEVLKPVARMLGHTLSAALAYAVWCGAEIIVARGLKLIFAFGTAHQIELFEKGETIIFYTGFGIWAISFATGAVRMVLAEVKLLGKN